MAEIENAPSGKEVTSTPQSLVPQEINGPAKTKKSVLVLCIIAWSFFAVSLVLLFVSGPIARAAVDGSAHPLGQAFGQLTLIVFLVACMYVGIAIALILSIIALCKQHGKLSFITFGCILGGAIVATVLVFTGVLF